MAKTDWLRQIWTSDRTPWGWLAAIVVVVIYTCTWTPWWTVGGDAELYLAAARNVARGDGYRYNGQPIGPLITPLWVLILAGAMKLTTSIGLLKMLTLGSIAIFLLCSYVVLRRMVDRRTAALAIIAVAVLHPLTELADTFFTDPPFCAAVWLSIVAGLWARDRLDQERFVQGGLLALGCLLLVLAGLLLRWPGVLWAPAAALAFMGRPRDSAVPLPDTSWWARRVCQAALVLSAGFVFIFARQAFIVDPGDVDPRYSDFITQSYELVADDHVKSQLEAKKILYTPQYLGVLCWNLVQRTPPYWWASFWLATVALLPILIGMGTRLARRQWLWAIPIVYLVPIILRWPHPIARYALPAAPVIMAAFIVGVAWLWKVPESRPWRWLTGPDWRGEIVPRLALRGTVAVCTFFIVGIFAGYNTLTWGLEVLANHRASAREASLVAVGEAVQELEGEVAVTSVRIVGKRRLRTMGPRRAVQFVADRPLMDAPPVTGRQPNRRLLAWAEEQGLRWYVDRVRLRKFGPLYRGPPEYGRWRLWERDEAEKIGWREVPLHIPDRTPTRLPISPSGRP